MSLTLYNKTGLVQSGGFKLYQAATTPFVNEKSLLFDGVDESVDLGANFDNDGTNPITVSTWVKLSSTGLSANLVFSKRDGGSNIGYEFNTVNDGRIIIEFINASKTLYGETSTGIISNDVWHHLIYTYDGSQTLAGCKAYLNNSVVTFTTSTDDFAATSASNAVNADIGNRNNDSGGMLGHMKDFGIWTSVVSTSDRADIYNGGTPVDLTGISNPPNHLYRLGDTPGDDATSVMNDTGATGGINGTPINMESGDIVTDAP